MSTIKTAKVYAVTSWYAKCPDCKAEWHVRDDAPPFFAMQIHCIDCDSVFEADLEERIAERVRQERLRLEPLEQRRQADQKPAQLKRIEQVIEKLGKNDCTCSGKSFGQHGVYCEAERRREVQKRERSYEW